MKRAVVYKRKGKLFVSANSQTTMGLWIDDLQYESETVSAPTSVIGSAVSKALEGSRTGVPHPTSWTERVQVLPKAAGVKSWNTFAKIARCLSIEASQTIRITPTRNQGSSGGFVPIEDAAIELAANASAEEIGQAVLKALALAT